MKNFTDGYLKTLNSQLQGFDWDSLQPLADALLSCRLAKSHIYLCGNGGSAGNAMHLANDFLFGVEPGGESLKVECLSSNVAVLTCLANDIDYSNIFSHQLKVKAKPGDMLIVLSGSGNSANIVKALEQAKRLGVKSAAILGFSGGKAKTLADIPLHFEVDDMQVAEDLQLIVGHMLMQYLRKEISS